MRREQVRPRPDWVEKVEALGFDFHTHLQVNPPEPYWDESACYVFTMEEVEQLEAATAELHRLALEAAAHIVAKERYPELGIPPRWWGLIERSWRRGDFSLFGRFDLLYAPGYPPKLLEYNADTPTTLLEAAVVQWFWKEEVFPEADQWNRLHEALIERWQALLPTAVHLTYYSGSLEDQRTVEYLADTAAQAGHSVHLLSIEQVGWDGSCFVDEAQRPIRTLFKLYPWEWWIHEEFGLYLLAEPFQPIEPAWKMLLSNKGLLAILWELFPGHPNLLPAYFQPERLPGPLVEKPLFSREGANLTVRQGQALLCSTPGPYGQEGFVYQAYQPPPAFDGRHPVLGAWIVGEAPAGLGIREDRSPITQNTSCFVPHRIEV
ncbi:glutathionylspermidine synthase family protein [Meiothermus sp. QL-1]|uniref:glutathionylspermidine synthase family protein n=1 Tax=Meiothermus sp. QL-1 TaxID=2058095 RepID=UPI000E0B1214|nr:glutathionylspermidine synthase family protein [Meiothermus sp. QL-1]RDI95354.1 glutathionylspermidine synthase family protein [Meiothermus sp. QL-1]